MPNLKGLADEFIIMIFITLFLLINFDAQVGNIYLGMSIFMILIYLINSTSGVFMYPIEKKNNSRIDSFMWAIVAYVVFNFISNQLMHMSASKFIGSTFASSPILQKSTSLAIGIWGGIIPFVETVSFVLLMFLVGVKLFKSIDWNKLISSSVLMILTLISLSFGLFHLNVRGVVGSQPNIELMLTSIFMVISVLLVLWKKQLIEAILFHVIANVLGVLNTLGLTFSVASIISSIGTLPIIIVGIALWFFVFKNSKWRLFKSPN